MQVIADLQLHSKYSRAVSTQMTIPFIADWARKKGIGLVATGDWTHPLWIREIQTNLTEVGNGILALNGQETDITAPKFMLATEISSIYSQGGKLRRVHTLVWVPTIESAQKIIAEMKRRGCNLGADGRPIVGLSCINLAELILSIDPTALLIPAHAWTPWFSVYGSLGGFDSLDDAFGPFAKQIYAIETGLSSNPAMNWRIKELDHRSIVSFSDAHSGPKEGREATVFELQELSYNAIRDAIIQRFTNNDLRITNNQISYTVEFYPEEGKYHFTGHRNCQVKYGPEDTRVKGTTCPVCGKSLTQGVLQRIEQLADRDEESLGLEKVSGNVLAVAPEILATKSRTFPDRPPFVMLVPLQEIIAESVGTLPGSQKVQNLYEKLVDELQGEFTVLLNSTIDHIAESAGRAEGARVAGGVEKVRRGDITIDPGFDGVFGKVKIWKDEKESNEEGNKDQLALF